MQDEANERVVLGGGGRCLDNTLNTRCVPVFQSLTTEKEDEKQNEEVLLEQLLKLSTWLNICIQNNILIKLHFSLECLPLFVKDNQKF